MYAVCMMCIVIVCICVYDVFICVHIEYSSYYTYTMLYTGETPRKNIDVMSAVSQQIAQQAAAKIAEGNYYCYLHYYYYYY